ncbi:hypothetical protein AVEN_142237-1 [Araneus ventricosus]|uniref:Mos1 transposase HTH domain-containing protein n=1 Tax=Araneus ventricosus TaxID=182803 RepID=A0A4Y2PSZ7_ARAVE|nr:hypothetical protein AVEN_142237-1 [Araneus ventricosus]
MDSSRSAQTAVIQFLRAEGEHASQIYRRMKEVYAVTNSTTIAAVDELIRQNRRITTREIAVELSISKGTLHHIIHKKLDYGKVCAQWVIESEDGENGCLPDPAVSTLKPSTPFLRAGISASVSMAFNYSCTVPHEL